MIARRNTRALLAQGAYEADAAQYPFMIALHASWLVSLWVLGLHHAVQPVFFGLFVLLQAARFWVLATLGSRWTTRIIIVPWQQPIATGPFRFVRHPNYLVVACELPCVSLALGLPLHAAIFGVLNLAMIAWRVRSENAAFAAISR